MLVHFHIALISAGVLFCFGFSAYAMLREGSPPSGVNVGLSALFAALGIVLSLYLRRVVRDGVRP